MATENSSADDGATPGSAAQTGTRLAAGLRHGVLPMRQGKIAIGELIDLYMANYDGRDPTRVQRLAWWRSQVGQIALEDLSDDHVHAAIEQLAAQPSRYYSGRDAFGAPVFKKRARPLSPATLNRYLAAIAAVISWAVRRRIAPKGFVHPCRTVGRRTENNEQTRFLSDDERKRLIDAAGQSSWPKLQLLVFLALTTGARKGELLSLKWSDIDFDRGLAYCAKTKNGDAKSLPLVPFVLDMLRGAKSSPSALIFCSPRDSQRARSVELPWRQALKAAKIRNFRFHDLRHSCASMLAQNGATLLEIADVLGHRQLQVTKRYSHLTTAHKAALVGRVWSFASPQGENREA